MAAILLTKGYAATVDDEDFVFLSQWKWSTFMGRDNRPYAGRRDGPQKTLVLMHRFLNGTPDDLLTDHRDGDTLNNRRANLRDATTTENQMNKAPQRGGSSPLKGAWRDDSPRNRKKWRSAIRINGRLKYLGRFETEDGAAAAYAAAASEHFGEFACTSRGEAQ